MHFENDIPRLKLNRISLRPSMTGRVGSPVPAKASSARKKQADRDAYEKGVQEGMLALIYAHAVQGLPIPGREELEVIPPSYVPLVPSSNVPPLPGMADQPIPVPVEGF